MPKPLDPRGSGLTRSLTFIPATKFVPRYTSDGALVYDSFNFWNSSIASGRGAYQTILDLEPGLKVDWVSCLVDDASATNDVTGYLYEYKTGYTTLVGTITLLDSASTAGSSGKQWLPIYQATGAGFVTALQDYPNYSPINYTLMLMVANDTSLNGCNVWWTRQIAPAPATASFTDVPPSHWAFQYVEALKSSKITTGATPTTFNPNGTVSRAEMAVFLARGLGLSYPY
jgi:hypothetical protein